MYDVSREGAWLPWISFFLDAVTESALGTIRVVERLLDLQGKYRERFQTARRSALLPRIIDLAFEQPAMTITDLAERIGVTYQAAANNVAALVETEIAVEFGSHPKVIIFPEIIEALRLEG